MKFNMVIFLPVFLLGFNTMAQAPISAASWTDTGVIFQSQFDPLSKGTVSSNAGHIEWDCAHADLETAVSDGQGGFVATGTYTPEHSGPTRPGKDDSTRALFLGVVNGDQLMLNLVEYRNSGFSSQTTLILNHDVKNRHPFKCR